MDTIRPTSDERAMPSVGDRSLLQDCSDCACLLNDEPNLLSFHTVLTTPVVFSLELTPSCNNRCPGCSNVFIADKSSRRDQRARPSLDLDGWRAVLDVIAPHARHLKLTGGEPTLHPQFAALLGEICRRDIPFTLFTNGRWRRPVDLIRLLCDVPQCTGLLVSLHGADAPTHEAFCGVPGAFAETIGNIRRATAAGLTVATSTVITQHNAHQVDAVVRLAQQLGADHAVFNRYLGPSSSDVEPTQAQLRAAVCVIDTLAVSGAPVRYGNCIPQCFVSNGSVGCLAGSAYATLDPWGNLRPCNHDALVCGNVLTQPLEAIWHGEAMNRWRAILPNACADCAALDRCRVGCRAAVRQWGKGQDPLYQQAALPVAAEPTVGVRVAAR